LERNRLRIRCFNASQEERLTKGVSLDKGGFHFPDRKREKILLIIR